MKTRTPLVPGSSTRLYGRAKRSQLAARFPGLVFSEAQTVSEIFLLPSSSTPTLRIAKLGGSGSFTPCIQRSARMLRYQSLVDITFGLDGSFDFDLTNFETLAAGLMGGQCGGVPAARRRPSRFALLCPGDYTLIGRSASEISPSAESLRSKSILNQAPSI